MHISNSVVSLAFALAFLMSSCATVHYSNHINSSFLQEKGETQIGGAVNLSSINVQASHALSDHVRLAADCNFWGWNVRIGESSDGASGLQSSLMAGYYKPLGERAYFEALGGVGVGILEDDFLSKVYLQPAFGFGDDRPKFIINPRVAYVNNAVFGSPGVDAESGDSYRIEGVFLDAGVTHRRYWDSSFLFIQYGLSHDFEHFGDNRTLPFLNFGVNWVIR